LSLAIGKDYSIFKIKKGARKMELYRLEEKKSAAKVLKKLKGI
jgi:hypothetical protein